MTTDYSIIGSLDSIQPSARFSTRGVRDSDKFFPHERPSFNHATPDFVGSLENIKQLVRLIDSEGLLEQPSGLTIHKLGQTIILDRSIRGDKVDITGEVEDEGSSLDDALLLLPSSVLEEISDQGRLMRTSAVNEVLVKNTFIHVRGDSMDDSDVEVSRYHSAPPFCRSEAEEQRLQVSLPGGFKNSMITDLVQSGVERPILSVLPFSQEGQPSPLSRITRAVEWNIAGFSVLLGCDIVVMDHSASLSSLASVKNLDPLQHWPSPIEAREAWLENSLLQLNRVAWVNKEKRAVDLVTTTSELSIQADVNAMLESIKRILVFLHEECKGQGSTYCLVRGEADECLLYDVTDLPKDCDVLQVTPELAGPIAELSYAISSDRSFKASRIERKKLLEKAFRLISAGGDSDLNALVAIDLIDCTNVPDERLKIFISTLNRIDFQVPNQTTQKLLVLAVSELIKSSNNLAHALLAKSLLSFISAERRNLECPLLVKLVDYSLGRALVFTSEIELDDDSACLFSKLEFLELPSCRKGKLELALELLADSTDFEARGVALNELANEAFRNSEGSIENIIELLIRSISEFSRISDSQTPSTKRYLCAVFMNFSKTFKILSLIEGSSVLTFPKLIYRLRALSFARAASRVSKSLSESIVGTELFFLGLDLIDALQFHTHLHGELDPSIEALVDKTHAAVNKSQLNKFFGSQKRIVPGISLGPIRIKAETIAEMRAPSVDFVARGCFELSLLFSDNTTKQLRRAQVDYGLARLMTESNAKGAEALRHIKRSLEYWNSQDDDEWVEKSVLLQTSIMYKLGDFKGAMKSAVDFFEVESIKACMRTVCLAEVKNGGNTVAAKKILECLIRGKGSDEIKSFLGIE